MKKLLLIFVICNLSFSMFAWNPEILNGKWVPQHLSDYLFNSPPSSLDSGNIARGVKNGYDILSIIIRDDSTGGYGISGLVGFQVKSITQLSDDTIELYLYYQGEDLGKVTITIIDENYIYTEDEVYTNNNIYYRRATGPRKETGEGAVINDTRVRLRTDPNLESNTWAFLNTGDEVVVLEQSSSKVRIGDMNNYWYKVSTEKYPDGWVYGAFIELNSEDKN